MKLPFSRSEVSRRLMHQLSAGDVRPAKAGFAQSPGRLLNQGFTLVELFITLVVVGILVSYALPGFSNLILQSKLDSSVDKLTQAVAFSRNISLNTSGTERVVMCPSDNAESAAPACRPATETDYNIGWLIFVDCDSDDMYDSGGNECGVDALGNDIPEELMRVQPAIPDLVMESTNTDRIRFTSAGRAISAVTFDVKKDGVDYSTIQMNSLGKVDITYHDFF